MQTLSPDVKRRLIEYCARELNFNRYGSHIPFYLWEASNRREVEVVLEAAEQFFARSRRVPSESES